MNADSALRSTATATVVRGIHAMANGSRADFDTLYHPWAVDRENVVQPPSSRVPGPAGFYSTALWLRAAFADLHYDIHHVVADDDGLVAVNSTMNGRHVAPFVVYTPDGEIDAAFPPTNRTFAMTQSHWVRVEDGKIVEHWANRDDLGHAKQLRWLPPTPTYLIRMARAKSRARRTLSGVG
jgi:predicted ester cyclase